MTYIICFPLVMASVFLVPFTAIYFIIHWIITGSDKHEDIIFIPMEYAIDLPWKILNI